jgi:hypothetical protein
LYGKGGGRVRQKKEESVEDCSGERNKERNKEDQGATTEVLPKESIEDCSKEAGETRYGTKDRGSQGERIRVHQTFSAHFFTNDELFVS